MKTLDIRPSPEVQQAMNRPDHRPQASDQSSGFNDWARNVQTLTINHGAAIEELTMQFAVQQQMLRDVWGIKKYEERRDKAIATLFPPTEEAKEIERLRLENESLKDMLARAQSGQDNVVTEDEDDDSINEED